MLLDRDGVHIHFEVTGAGPPILLTHGFAASAHMFGATVPALAAEHTVITWDLRGHGRSDYPHELAAYSVSLAVGDMTAVLDQAGAERAVLLGHSLGGYLSLELALTHPERVDALVLVGTGPGYRRPEGRSAWNAMAERYARDLEERGLGGLPASAELRPAVHRSADGLVLAARGLLTQHDGRVLDALPTMAVPTLVVVGDEDQPFLAPSRYMAERIPGARLATIPGAGHAPMVTHPQQLTAEVTQFLSRLATDDRRA